MSERFQQELARQKALEAERERQKEEKLKHSQAVLSDVSQENSGIAHALGLSTDAFHSLASEPELFKKFLSLIGADEGIVPEVPELQDGTLNPKHKRTQKTSRVTGTIFNTTNWDSFFDPKKRGK